MAVMSKPVRSLMRASGFSSVSSSICTCSLIATRSMTSSNPRASRRRSMESQAIFWVRFAIGVYSMSLVRLVSTKMSDLMFVDSSNRVSTSVAPIDSATFSIVSVMLNCIF